MRFLQIGKRSLLSRRSFCTALLTVPLAGITGCGSGRMNSEAIAVDPYSVTLSPGQSQEFTYSGIESSPETVSWKVQEGDKGGTIEIVPQEDFALGDLVVYTAPQTPGTYHVQATAKFGSGATKTATATVEVK